MPQAISQAETAGKRLLVEEWGSKVGTDREANLATNIKALADLGVPWLYWQFITNPDQHQEDDFEVRRMLHPGLNSQIIRLFACADPSERDGLEHDCECGDGDSEYWAV